MSEKKTTITITMPVGGTISGKTTFRGGVHKTRKDRQRNRKDKYGKRLKERQLRGEE